MSQERPTEDLAPDGDAFERRYQRLRRIGAGGMGEVWLHRDTELKREVAVKHLNPTMSSHPEVRARRRSEGQTAACLKSPYIAQVYDQDEWQGLLRIVFEFVDGETLGDRRRRLGRLSWSELAPIAAAIARGLEAAHAEGIVHRDLKPGNVMLPRDPARAGAVAKLVDWGLAIGAPDLGASGTTGDPFRFAGTPEYMAPERLVGESGPPADVWSLGCVLFECLVGERAFERSALERIIAGAADYTLLPADLPDDVEALLRACLEPDPRRRPDSMRRILEVVDRAETTPLRNRVPLPPLAPSDVPRAEYVDALVEALRSGWCVSVSGPLGVGKSWIARAALDRVRGEFECAFVSLPGVSEPNRAARMIDAELGACRGQESPILFLDDADGVAGALPKLFTAVRRSLKAVVVTSRRPIAGAGWRVRPVEPLEVPAAHADHAPNALLDYDAVRFFCVAARERWPAFRLDASNAEAVANICRHLGGIPAALALVGAQCHCYAPADLLDRLAEVLEPLTGSRVLHDGDAAAGTVEHTVAWSVDRLSDKGRALLERLAIFAGSWTLSSALAVCGSPDLAVAALHGALNELVDSGLVRFEPTGGRSRYRLFAPVRSHLLATGRLATDRVLREQLAALHLAECVGLASTNYSGFGVRLPSPLAHGQTARLERMDRDFADCVEAIEFARRDPARLEQAVDLAIAIQSYRVARGLRREGIATLDALIEQWGDRRDLRMVRLHAARGNLRFAIDDERPRALEDYRRALSIERMIAASAAGSDGHREQTRLAGIIHNVALLGLQIEPNPRTEARGHLSEAMRLYESLEDKAGRTATRLTLAQFLVEEGRLDEASGELEAVIESCLDAGDVSRIAFALHMQATVALRRGDTSKALALCVESLARHRQLGDEDGIAESLRLGGEVRAAEGRLEDAAFLFGAGARRRERVGSSIPRNELRRYEEALRRARKELGHVLFSQRWNEGAEGTDAEGAARLAAP